MTTELTKQVVVLRSGHLVQFEWACNALKEAGVPFFTREETSGGLRLAMPVAPATGPGVSWAVLVPEPAVPEARAVLAELPFEVHTEAGIWDFEPTRKVKIGWKVYAAIVLALTLVSLIVGAIQEFRRYR
jgi:hypothetical protein